MVGLGPLAKEATGLASKHVSGWSDFRVQRTNPYEGAFADTPECAGVAGRLLESHPGIDPALARSLARSGFCNALDAEKLSRMRAMAWDPYGDHESSKA